MARLSRLVGSRFILLCLLVIGGVLGGIVLSQTTPANLPAKASRVKPTVATQDCISGNCHGTLVNRKVMHGPVAQNRCLDCHKYDSITEHRFKSLAAPDQGCTSCHDMKHKTVMHTPVKEGRCTACHDAHGSAHPKMLLADPGKDYCYSCHKQEKFAKKTFVHTPVNLGACNSCHESHSSAQAQLLKKPAWELCVSCHKQEVPKPGEALSTHAPARDNCLACHEAHESNLKHDLKQAAPDLCLSCHKNVKDSIASSPVVHGAVKQEGSCSNCHVPHFSKLAALQKQSQPQQCLTCHDREQKATDGRKLTNMASLLKENTEHHGPIRLGACTACHQPHAGNQVNLLTSAYPPEFYAPFRADLYKLCFTCHSPDLVLVKENGPTAFADGKKNLHSLHVNQEKGRTCRACHEVHASQQPFHIRDSVPFGPNNWLMAIKFRQTETGGSCSPGCHTERSYDHGKRPKSIPFVALTPKGQELMNPNLAKAPPTIMPVSGSGFPVSPPPFTPGVFPCTGCHDPNVAVNTQKRALQKPHVDIKLQHGEDNRWCLDCHNTQNRDVLRSASGEPIPYSESYKLCGQCHGVQYRDWKAGLHGKRTGEWDGKKQYLLCVGCHDPHAPKFKQLTPMPPPLRPNPKK